MVLPRLFWGNHVKRTFISAAAILAFAASAHADELTDIQAQAKQLREQMTKRIADLEKRQKALEAQKAAAPTISPVDAMAADLPNRSRTTTSASRAFASMATSTWVLPRRRTVPVSPR
jgi:phage shock protein A